MITVMLVDDHAIVREGFKRLVERQPDIKVVGESGTRRDAPGLIEARKPALIITDLSLPDGSGLAMIRDLRKSGCASQYVVLSMHAGAAFVREALMHGVMGYVTKGAAADELVDCIRVVASGGRYLSSDISPSSHSSPENSHAELTPRERQALQLLVRGLVPKAVAAELNLNVKTLYGHRASLMEKLGARNDRDLVRLALERGLI